MRRPLILLALIWSTFIAIFPFAAAGDTSFLHIGSHLIQLGYCAVLIAFARSLLSGRMLHTSSAHTSSISCARGHSGRSPGL